MLLSEFEEKLGYTFQDQTLLVNALTHSSYANEHKREGAVSNERLEFLGDAVLGLIVGEHLFHTHPDKPEGELTKIRAELVCERSLVEAAEQLQLAGVLRLGHGESHGDGGRRKSMLADAVEAVLAAAYLDGGIEVPTGIVTRLIFRKEPAVSGNLDYKTRLQELVQHNRNQVIAYELTGESGPDHDKLFTVDVLLNGRVVGTGTGSSKKRAEQSAAREAIARCFPDA